MCNVITTEEECDNVFGVDPGSSDKVNCYGKLHKNIYQDQISQEFKRVCKYANCGETFISEQYLMEHMKDVHNQDKELSRQQSGSQLKTLVEVKSHTTLKWFVCPECGRKSRQKYLLEEHMNGVHNKFKPYKCLYPGCYHRTAYKANLNAHVKSKHCDNKLKLTCYWPQCTFATFNNYYLRQHYRKHNGCITAIQNKT